jgi:outer membrane lipoprotein SlyB
MESTQSRLHPILWAAAVAVIVFSAVGIAAITGVLPVAGSKPSEPPAAAVPAAPAPGETPSGLPADSGKSVVPATAKAGTELAPKAAAAKPEHAAEARPTPKPATHAKPKPIQVAQNEAPVVERDTTRGYEAPPPVSPACRDCGVIESVREIKTQGEGSGLGAVAGGVLGGVLGHQVGGGRGKDVATVLGAVGGAVAGHQVEKNVRTGSKYEVAVRFDDGSSQVFRQDQAPAWRSGDRVKVVNGVVTAD